VSDSGAVGIETVVNVSRGGFRKEDKFAIAAHEPQARVK
jgi:hypothetical protein